MSGEQRRLYAALRHVYAGLLLNGPFAVIIANHEQMMALTDRIRLRPLTAATSGNVLFLSSEEAAIRIVSPEPDNVWTPMGGVPVVGRLGSLPTPESSVVRRL